MKRVLLWVILFLIGAELAAQIKLPRLISNGMILQRDIPLKIWGWSAAHENVTISFLNKEYSAQADKNGNWTVVLPKQKAGGPYTMQLKASNIISLSDILIGDVWVCGGKAIWNYGWTVLNTNMPVKLPMPIMQLSVNS